MSSPNTNPGLLKVLPVEPFLSGKNISDKTLKAIWKDARKLMCEGMVDRRIVGTRAKDRPRPAGKQRKLTAGNQPGHATPAVPLHSPVHAAIMLRAPPPNYIKSEKQVILRAKP